ncbi:tetratricopeptide repeat protein [Brevibacillus laterosporus]|uniref:tetratricopeptide repeat protein n=1 Tax=Brevibacillus laterosporus TaxID=1465 RepID=UPI001F554D6F|nr:tetratricopeptide repeat protein [Brevibacillus laterosporus]
MKIKSIFGVILVNVIGSQIKQIRMKLNMTQGELADGICSRSYISQLEMGYSLPLPDLLTKIAERLQVPMSELYEDCNREEVIKVNIHRNIRGLIANIEVCDWKKAHKYLFRLSDVQLNQEEKSIYVWGKGALARSEQHFYQSAAYFLESIELVREARDPDPLLLIRPLTSLGELYASIEQPEKAISHLYEAQKLALQHDIHGIPLVTLYYALGYMHERLGEYHSGLERFRQAEKLNIGYSSLYKSGDIYMGIGVCLRHLKQYEEAEQANRKALNILEYYNDPKKEARIAGVNNNLGIIYRCTEKYDLAISHLQKAIEIHKRIGSIHWLNNSCIELAKVYNQLGRYEEAKSICEEVIVNYTTEHILAEAYLTIADSLCHVGEKSQALDSIENALAYFSRKPNNRFFVKASSLATKMALLFGEEVTHIYDKYLAAPGVK